MKEGLEDFVIPAIVRIITFSKSDNLLPSQRNTYYPNASN